MYILLNDFRCVCNTELCNEKDSCDIANKCFEPDGICEDVCPTCPPGGSAAGLAASILTLGVAALVALL